MSTRPGNSGQEPDLYDITAAARAAEAEIIDVHHGQEVGKIPTTSTKTQERSGKMNGQERQSSRRMASREPDLEDITAAAGEAEREILEGRGK